MHIKPNLNYVIYFSSLLCEALEDFDIVINNFQNEKIKYNSSHYKKIQTYKNKLTEVLKEIAA